MALRTVGAKVGVSQPGLWDLQLSSAPHMSLKMTLGQAGSAAAGWIVTGDPADSSERTAASPARAGPLLRAVVRLSRIGCERDAGASRPVAPRLRTAVAAVSRASVRVARWIGSVLLPRRGSRHSRVSSIAGGSMSANGSYA